MECTKTCFLIFTSLIMMTGGFVLTLSGWFAPAIREAVFRVRMAGPIILLIGFLLLLSACALCAYHQKRCCVFCYVHDKRKNVYPGPEYPFTEHMVELAAPPGLNTLSYEYQNEANDFVKTGSPEPVWHKKESAVLKPTDDLNTSQMKPLIPHYSQSNLSDNLWKLRGSRVQLKSAEEDIHIKTNDNHDDQILSGISQTAAKLKECEMCTVGRPIQQLENRDRISPCKVDFTFENPPRNSTSSQLRGILKTQSLDRCKQSKSLQKYSVTSSASLYSHPNHDVTKTIASPESNGISPTLRDIKFTPRPRPLSQTDHTNCPIVSTPPVSMRKQVIVLPRPGSYRDMQIRPSPDRSPLLGIPKRGKAKHIPNSIV